jgi:hypothetical protein
MTKQGSSSPGHILPVQVWTGLSAEERARAVHLMVKLAFKLVTTRVTTQVKVDRILTKIKYKINTGLVYSTDYGIV